MGFKLDFWDYATFVALLLGLAAGTAVLLWLAGLPGRIAIARKHPDAEAVKLLGWAGFLPVVPWIQAFVWAFKPTEVVDIRRFPEEEARAVDEDIARLSGEARAAGAQLMIAALLVCFIYAVAFWLVFFKFKWIKFNIVWGVVSGWVGLHLLLAFLIGLRFVTPYSTDARVIQHTIQLVPRLTEPTLVTAVLVEPDVPVKKGQPLFQFDRRPYEYRVRRLEAQLAQATQNVAVLKADVDVAAQQLAKARSETEYASYQKNLSSSLAAKGAGPEEDAARWDAQLKVAQAAVKAASAELERARLVYASEIDGVNTSVAAEEAELAQARFYLDNTTLVAPEDGRIVNLQVRPGMVAGDLRLGAIASFICDDDRYLLANFSQENLKFMADGQPAEIALDLYPGQIFPAKVVAIWRASGTGQLLPSGTLPDFEPAPPKRPQGQYAVKLVFDGADQSKFPIGAEGAVAIYTGGMKGGWAAMRRIGIRTYSWLNWLYPIPF